MSFTRFPVTFLHNTFAFNAHLNSDGSENQANVQATAMIHDAAENPGFRDLHDPFHLTQGGQLGRVHKGFRVIELRGTIFVAEGLLSARYAALDDKVRAMRAAFDPAICYRDSSSTDGAYQLQFQASTADTGTYATGRIPLQYWARPVGQPYIFESITQRGTTDFRIPLLMGDPRSFEQTAQSLSLTPGAPSGSVVNKGDTAGPVKLTVTMNGAGSASFTLTRSGVAIIFDLSGFANNDVLVANMEWSAPYGRGRYITKNGTENARLKTSAASTWLDAPVGTTTFTISNTANVRTAVIDYYSARA